jgi:hypothetical protein
LAALIGEWTGGDAHNISILFGSGNGNFKAATSYAVEPNTYRTQTLDLNEDSFLNIAAAGYGDGYLRYLLNRGNATFITGLSCPSGRNFYSFTSGDNNRDGRDGLTA